jgi:hypothetical protein
MNIIEKINQIKSHPDFNNDRCINTIFIEMIAGNKLTEIELFEKVKESYKTGKHKSPSYIRNTFKRAIRFVNREFKDL